MPVVTPDLPEIFEEAFERAGLTMKLGYDLRTIRRSLNLLTLEWQNRQLNLFHIEAGTEAIVAGTASYTMPVDTIDLVEHQLRTGSGASQTDTNLMRVSVSTYAKQTNKNTTGRPTQIYVDRGTSDVTVTLWPVPSEAATLAYYRLKGTPGLSSGIGTTVEIPPRFVPALTAGLAFHIAMKRPEVADRVPMLKQEYESQFALAASEDETRASWNLTPMAGY